MNPAAARERQQGNLEACPSCRATHLICILGTELDCCGTCFRVWERLPPGEPYTVDGEQLPFKVPCDNCAFRGGSQERADADGWAALEHSLATGGAFYCHKAVPFKVTAPGEPIEPGEKRFEFPREDARVSIAGEHIPYRRYAISRMRLCRGYLNAYVAPLIKRHLAPCDP